MIHCFELNFSFQQLVDEFEISRIHVRVALVWLKREGKPSCPTYRFQSRVVTRCRKLLCARSRHFSSPLHTPPHTSIFVFCFTLYIQEAAKGYLSQLRMLSVNVDDAKQIQTLLERLRKEPVGSEGSTDSILRVIFDYLFKVPADSSDDLVHWFCQRADSVTREAATFLIRLFAYDSQRVNDWRARMKRLIFSCCDCVRGLQDAKRTSQETCVYLCIYKVPPSLTRGLRYLAVFPLKTRQTFIRSFDSWETTILLDGLAACGISPDGITSPASPTLLDAPPALVYLALSNLVVLQDSRVPLIFAKYTPTSEFLSWPSDPPPPGLFYLLFHESPPVRRWAERQMTRCQHKPMPTDQFVDPYLTAFSAVVDAFAMGKPTTNITTCSTFPFTLDTTSIWSAFAFLLHLLPSEYLRPGGRSRIDLNHIVAAHLHDTGPRAYPILRLNEHMSRRVYQSLRIYFDVMSSSFVD
jgi:senataxin